MRVEQLTCHIGAELSGVRLADAVHDEGLFAELRTLLLRHRVLFLRQQEISRADHVAFARRFGELELHPVFPHHPDHAELVLLGGNSKIPGTENVYHTDVSWRETPSMASVLRCVECPEVGGDTVWINMEEAYEKLPEARKQQIAKLFNALGDEHRQRILLTFEPGERLTAGQLAEVSTLARPTVSHHLKILREAGVLEHERQGKEIYFWLNKAFMTEALQRVLTYLQDEV